ncbi:MAG: EAL domain-containing protein [Acutalibacteraceae bacterium]
MVKKTTAVITACLILICSALSVSALVEYTAEPTGGKTVYIAGNPDMFPIEYYDSETKSYMGILPDLYAEISQSTGVDFTYIRSGSENEQNRLAKNRQAEIISAHIKGKIEELNSEVLLTSFEKEGETAEVCIGFTDIADSALVASVKEALEKIPDSELLALALKSSVQPRKNVSVRGFIAVTALLLIIIAVLVFLNIRRKIKAKKNLRNVLTDPLTGIGNAKYFEQTMKHIITPVSYSLYYIAYLSFDAQKAEKYFGTAEAEEIQRFAANTLASLAGELDFTARISDGVFLYAFQAPSEGTAGARIGELIDKLNDCDEKFAKEYRAIFKAGIFHMTEANMPFETVLLNSRQGCNYAENNKLPYAFADDKLLSEEASKARLQRKLADAIKNNEFKLYMQFIVDAKSGRITGAEALSRWQNTEEGILSPSRYIEAMHTSGVIKRLDFCIFEQVCRQLEEWSKTDKRDLWISCNFTRVTVSEGDFLKQIKETSDKYSFDRDKLVIEFTEDSLADDKATAYQNILACKKAGFKIALDDLGSGYSSFSDLCDYPIDIIKIDRHIVAKSVTPRGNALLRGITKLAHDLGIKVLCEGVETEKENNNSKNAECDFIQGYYYSRVLPQEETDTFISKYQAVI